ncbi:unannotated protein [freshwater metagenome]|uniref:Unannotated protein n=1 Tax=freshwater metagenome TaxID=449393 RepID=A0A6J7J4Y5_9ZZZZ
MEAVCLILLGWSVAAALLRDDMDDHRPVELLGTAERVLEFGDVVTVDRPDVLQAEVLEHALRRNDVLEALLHPVQGPVDGLADDRGALEHLLAP